VSCGGSNPLEEAPYWLSVTEPCERSTTVIGPAQALRHILVTEDSVVYFDLVYDPEQGTNQYPVVSIRVTNISDETIPWEPLRQYGIRHTEVAINLGGHLHDDNPAQLEPGASHEFSFEFLEALPRERVEGMILVNDPEVREDDTFLLFEDADEINTEAWNTLRQAIEKHKNVSIPAGN
jgi:hypothetical protein